MFIRFHPDQVIRLPSVATPLPKGEEFKQLAKLQLWHGIQLGITHTDVEAPWVATTRGVVTRVDDPAWPAAIALATDRSTLAFLDADFGSPMEPSILINGLKTGVQQAVEPVMRKPLAMTLIPSLIVRSWQLSINIPKMLRKYWQ